MDSMKIVALTAENIKRIVAVEIRPEDSLVEITGANEAGKQQPVSEPVLTPSGWRPIGLLQVGDEVIGANGKPTMVKGIFPQAIRDTFIVRMTDGGWTRCGPEHLWTVLHWKKRKGSKLISETLATAELIKRGLYNGDTLKFSVPQLSAPVSRADLGAELPIDPYVLGVLLGDGHIEKTGYITVNCTDLEIHDYLRSEARSYWDGAWETGTAEWSRPLRHLGLAGKLAPGKFIPSIYFDAPEEDRLALLEGLMDTDGSAAKSWAYFHSSSLQLANDVVNLGRSLGMMCKLSGPKTRKYRYKGELRTGLPSYDVLIKSNNAPFRLQRKVSAWSPSVRRPRLDRYIRSIERTHDEDSVCIAVEAEDGLYVTRDFIVTHNSSVLDSIWWALAGTRSHQPEPIRRGEDEAIIKLDLGNIVVKREFKRVKRKIDDEGTTEEKITTRISVTTGDGAKYPSPQSMLDSLLDSLSFDPLAFARMDAKAQYEQLKTLCGLDFSDLAAKRKTAYDERRDHGRDAKQHRAAAEQIVLPEDVPEDLIDITALSKRLQEAERENAAIAEQERERARRAAVVSEARTRLEIAGRDEEEAENALRRAVEHRQAVANEVAEAIEAVDSFPEIPERKDLSPLHEEIAAADTRNAAHRQSVERARLMGEATIAEGKAEECTATIEQCDAEAKQRIEAADMPVPGLSLENGVVTLDGFPFEQASGAQQLRVSCAIAMRGNHKLKVIRVRDGSLLDKNSLAVLREMAEKAGYQIWIERVDTSGMGFFLEDGRLKDTGDLFGGGA